MSSPSASAVRAALAAAVGADRVQADDETLRAHMHDTWPLALLWVHQGSLGTPPVCVVRPQSVEEVAAVLRYANREQVPVVPYGAGSGVCGGVLPPTGAIVVDLRSMDRLVELSETNLLARVQAGMMGARFEGLLNEQGYSMGHFPQSIALSTVGGWVATRAAGQFSTRYGNMEDMLAGLEVVLPDGRIVRIAPHPRRSAGPDLRHLFLGSEGTLAIVTELTVRIFPLPESRRMMTYSLPDFDAGLEALRAITRAGWRPPVLRLYDAVETARHFGQWAGDDACFLIIVSEGPATLTAAEIDGCHTACSALGGAAVGDQPAQHWLAERNNVPSLASFIERGFVLDTIEVASGWDRIHDLYREVVAAMRAVKHVIVASGHSSHSYSHGTNIYFTFVARPDEPTAAEPTYRACWQAAMDATVRVGGTIAHHHGIGRNRIPWMRAEHGEGLDVLQSLKKAIDPRGIMNPGVLLPDPD